MNAIRNVCEILYAYWHYEQLQTKPQTPKTPAVAEKQPVGLHVVSDDNIVDLYQRLERVRAQQAGHEGAFDGRS